MTLFMLARLVGPGLWLSSIVPCLAVFRWQTSTVLQVCLADRAAAMHGSMHARQSAASSAVCKDDALQCKQPCPLLTDVHVKAWQAEQLLLSGVHPRMQSAVE